MRMKLCIIGSGPLAEQAAHMAEAAGAEIVSSAAEADYVLPATEDESILKSLSGDNVLFDAEAWAVCSSRFATDEVLGAKGIPTPDYFPGGSEPYLVKPDRGSFGLGIWVTDDYCEVGGAVNAGFVTEEELPGDVWSVVVLGKPEAYTVYPPVRLQYDGRRRRTGAECVPAPENEQLLQTAKAAAEAIGVHGILEVEAMLHNGVWKVIDLNARIPMLTTDALLAKGADLLGEWVRL